MQSYSGRTRDSAFIRAMALEWRFLIAQLRGRGTLSISNRRGTRFYCSAKARRQKSTIYKAMIWCRALGRSNKSWLFLFGESHD